MCTFTKGQDQLRALFFELYIILHLPFACGLVAYSVSFLQRI